MKSVLVLLATHNGEKYILEQINSIYSQKNVNVDILISDDNSTDKTIELIEELHHNIRIIRGKFGSAQKNFYNLINNAPLNYDYYALSDQDDIWMDDKLVRAVEILSSYGEKNINLYHGSTITVDSNNNILNAHPIYYGTKNLKQSLVVSNAQGSTMVFNNMFLKKIQGKTPLISDLMHDSWLQKTAFLLNGNVYFDAIPCMRYRIHDNNVVAKKTSLYKRIVRYFKSFFSTKSHYKITIYLKEALNLYENQICDENLEIARTFLNSKRLKNRLKLFFSLKYRSKYKLDTIRFKYLAIRGKL